MLDIDRDRQRISLGLKQTQEDPWQRVVDTYNVGDELEGTVTKVVTFGAFVEILDGVEGLVHISELANHHVENPREVVQPGDDVRVKILEIDSERRRLSLSVKRVEGQVLPRRERARRRRVEGAGDLDDVPELGLSEDVFAGGGAARPRSRGAEDAEADAPCRGAEAAAEPRRRAPAEPEAGRRGARSPRPRPPRARSPRPRPRPRRRGERRARGAEPSAEAAAEPEAAATRAEDAGAEAADADGAPADADSPRLSAGAASPSSA